MGLFDKLKSLISKKEKIKEEVKKEYNVEEVSEISEDMIEDVEETEEHCCCGHCQHHEEKHECQCGEECECGDDKDEAITVNDICKMSPYELMKYFRNKKVYTLGDLVEYFIKNC